MFDTPPDELGFPCECGGSITPDGIHFVAGSFGDPPDPCCESYTCDTCGKTRYQHERGNDLNV